MPKILKEKSEPEESLKGTIGLNSIVSPGLTSSQRRKTSRSTADEYFMKVALVVSERATCRRHSVGSIIVKDRSILSTGYNGAPRGATECLTVGCLRDELKIPSGERNEICRAVHAEQNAIIQAAKHGADTQGSSMYCTHSPCNVCAKMMANAGIKEVIVFEKYADQQCQTLFQELGIDLRYLKKPDLAIDFYE